MNEFTSVKASLMAILRPDDFSEQVRLANMGRQNLLHAITNDQVILLALWMQGENPLDRMTRAEKYIVAVIESKFGTDDISALSERQLGQLRFTISRAIDNKRQKSGWTVAEMIAKAGLSIRPEAATEGEGAELVGALTSGAADSESGDPIA